MAAKLNVTSNTTPFTMAMPNELLRLVREERDHNRATGRQPDKLRDIIIQALQARYKLALETPQTPQPQQNKLIVPAIARKD